MVKKNTKSVRMEIGAVKKEWGGRVPIALVYPNTYYVGMSNLALHLLYKLLNDDPQILAERIFLSDQKILSQESRRPISDFRAVGFTFSFETDYLNIHQILGKDINPLRSERGKNDPVLLAGGPAVTLNLSALSEIFDAIVAGEVEATLNDILSVIKEPLHKDEMLKRLADIPGVFVPGTNQSENVDRLYVKNLNNFPTHSVIWTEDTEFGHMHLVEAARGCPWKCKFCATPPLYFPYRFRSADVIWESIEYGLPHRKHVGLIGADVLGHPNFLEIAEELSRRNVKVSTSSLRVNRISKKVAGVLARSGHRRAALGIESGTEQLRKSIDKDLSDNSIFRAVKNLSQEGITNLKLYFMIGLPGETDEDIEGIATLTGEIRKIILKERKTKTLAPNITLVVTPFVPKKATPFSDQPFSGTAYLEERLKRLRSLFKKIPNTKITGDPPRKALLEYTLSQGGPEITDLLLNSHVIASRARQSR